MIYKLSDRSHWQRYYKICNKQKDEEKSKVYLAFYPSLGITLFLYLKVSQLNCGHTLINKKHCDYERMSEQDVSSFWRSQLSDVRSLPQAHIYK